MDYTKVEAADMDTHIPANNVGYKLLLKMGWKAGTGLGQNASGTKYIYIYFVRARLCAHQLMYYILTYDFTVFSLFRNWQGERLRSLLIKSRAPWESGNRRWIPGMARSVPRSGRPWRQKSKQRKLRIKRISER